MESKTIQQAEALQSESERTKEDRPKRERLEKIIKDLESYDFKGFLEKLPNDLREMQGKVICGLPVRGENFETSNIHSAWVNRLEEAMVSRKITVFVGAPRMGKTSIAHAWAQKNLEAREVRSMQSLSKDSDIPGYIERIVRKGKNQVFLDEVPLPFLEAVIAAFKSADITYIINTYLPDAGSLIEILQSRGEDYEVITLPLVSDEELKQYITNRLDLREENDRLAESLAALSGGCPYIANGLCSVLLDTDKETADVNNAKEFSRIFLYKAHERMESEFQAWEEQRQTTPATLREYIPSPLLFLKKK